MQKLPFFILLFFIPYQIYRVIISEKKTRILHVLVGGVIALVCATSWPIYLNNWLCFSLIGLLFSITMFWDAKENKNYVSGFTSIILLVMSTLFFMMFYQGN